MVPKAWAVAQDRNALLGIALMVLVSAMMAVDSVLVRLLSPGVHPFVMGFTRALFGLAIIVPWIIRRKEILKTEYRSVHVVRAALKLAALVCFFFAFAAAPLADVTAIAFTSPIFVTLGAWIFLSESPQASRILAVVIGFAGVLVILRPGQASMPPGLVFALAGAVLTAAIQLILKKMAARDASETLVAWNLILTVPIAAVPALLVWSTPTPFEWAILAVQGMLGAVTMFLATRAMALAEASLITPFDFFRLPFVALLGYLIFAQAVPVSTWVGGTIIFVASLLMARSARRRILSATS